MATIEVDTGELNDFISRCERAGNGLIKQQLSLFLEGIGMDFLRIIQDEIIKRHVIDTSLLLSSFQKNEKNSVWTLDEGALTLEVGTNVKYAADVNYGHKQTSRFVPGDVVTDGDGKIIKFTYNPSAKTGMMLSAKFVEGKHYWEAGLAIIEKLFPQTIEKKMNEWLNNYFGR